MQGPAKPPSRSARERALLALGTVPWVTVCALLALLIALSVWKGRNGDALTRLRGAQPAAVGAAEADAVVPGGVRVRVCVHLPLRGRAGERRVRAPQGRERGRVAGAGGMATDGPPRPRGPLPGLRLLHRHPRRGFDRDRRVVERGGRRAAARRQGGSEARRPAAGQGQLPDQEVRRPFEERAQPGVPVLRGRRRWPQAPAQGDALQCRALLVLRAREAGVCRCGPEGGGALQQAAGAVGRQQLPTALRGRQLSVVPSPRKVLVRAERPLPDPTNGGRGSEQDGRRHGRRAVHAALHLRPRRSPGERHPSHLLPPCAVLPPADERPDCAQPERAARGRRGGAAQR